jgi:glycerophosphoryl diester phosphodiesterase
MYAFRRAAEAGVDLLEMDVRITADGVLVVHHDADVFGTTGGEGVVSEMTVAELQELDNAWWWSSTCWPCRDLADDDYPFRGVRTGDAEPPEGFTADDFRIETFRSVAEAFPTLALDVEIKNRGDHTEAAIAALVADLDALDRRDSVVVVSFSSDVVAAFNEAAPDVATSPGTDEMIAWILGGETLGDHPVVQVPPNYDGIEVLMEAFFTAVEEAGVEVWVWPDSTDQEAGGFYAELLDLGIDGIIAGRPAVLEQVLQDGGYVD